MANNKYEFQTTHGAQSFRNGQRCTITRELDDNERDLAEVGRMFRVTFEDGGTMDVFADELTPPPPAKS